MEKQNEKTKSKGLGLSKKEFILSVIIPVVTFMLGGIVSFTLNRLQKDPEPKIISDNKEGGYNQTQVINYPPVKAYIRYLRCITSHRWDEAWDLLLDEQRGEFENNKESLPTLYYLTTSYQVRYVMLQSEKDFLILLRYKDAAYSSQVGMLKYLVQTAPVVHDGSKSTVEETINGGALSEEIFTFINSRFKVDNEAVVREKIDSALRARTMTQYVESDWRTPIAIASNLNLTPKKKPEAPSNEEKLFNEYLLQEVHMEKDDGKWKIRLVKTKALGRWK